MWILTHLQTANIRPVHFILGSLLRLVSDSGGSQMSWNILLSVFFLFMLMIVVDSADSQTRLTRSVTLSFVGLLQGLQCSLVLHLSNSRGTQGFINHLVDLILRLVTTHLFTQDSQCFA